MLASYDSARGGLGRARVVSRRGVLFSFFFQIKCSMSQVSICIDISLSVNNETPCVVDLFVCHFLHFSFCLTPCVVSQPCRSRTLYILPGTAVPGMYEICTVHSYVQRCCCCCSVLLYCWCCRSRCCFLLLFVIVCTADSSNVIPVFFFHSNTIDFSRIHPLAALNCRIYGLELTTVHPSVIT